MKLRRALIENFKGIKHLEIDFTNGGSPRPVTALLGNNGSGKTTALQAIALVLSLATGKTSASDQFAWNGFRAERLGTLGNTHVELDVEFDPGEHETSWRLFNAWVGSMEGIRRREIYGSWENVQSVTLTFENGGLREERMRLEMFKGRYFIGELIGRQPALRSDYPRVGDVFWFDQMRDLGRTWKEDKRRSARDESWARGVDELRESLVGAWAAHRTSQNNETTDFISALESLFQKVFPDIIFHGVEPMGLVPSGTVKDYYFLLERDGKVFDISEMSSGEQAVFPLAYEFVRLNIAKSIVLIDELELHLHPPQQQALLRALTRIGPDCQFIITTHSPYLEQVIPDEHEVRLDGALSCL